MLEKSRVCSGKELSVQKCYVLLNLGLLPLPPASRNTFAFLPISGEVRLQGTPQSPSPPWLSLKRLHSRLNVCSIYFYASRSRGNELGISLILDSVCVSL